MTPEQHGVSHVWGRKDGTSQTHADVRDKCVWNILYPNVTCDIVGMPITWPPSPVGPRFISGHYQSDLSYWYYPEEAKPPKDFKEWMEPAWWFAKEPEETVPWTDAIKERMNKEEFLDKLKVTTNLYTAYWLATQRKADLGMLGYTFLDRALHLWNEPEVMEELAYWCVDIICRMFRALDPEKILIVSDHGWDAGGHNHNGVLATYGFNSFGGEKEEWKVWDVAQVIAATFDVSLNVCPGVYERVGYAQMMERLRRMGYVE